MKNNSSGNWSIITVRIFFSCSQWSSSFVKARPRHGYFDFTWFGAFQFECWRGKVRKPFSTSDSSSPLFPQQWQPKVKKSSTTHCEVSFTLFYFLANLNFTLISEPNSLRVSFSQSRSFETTETLSFLVYFFTLFEFLDNPKLKGYVYDNIVCDLKVIFENFHQTFYFELAVKIILQYCSTGRGHGHGRLADVEIWNAVSSLALLILEQFKAQLLLISKERRIVRIQQAEFLFDERHTLKTLEFTIRIGSTPTFLYFNLNTAHCKLRLFHYVKSSVWYRLVDHTFVIQHTLRM